MPENWCVLGTRICLNRITIALYYVRVFKQVLLVLIICFSSFLVFHFMALLEDHIFAAVTVNVTVLWDLTTLKTF